MVDGEDEHLQEAEDATGAVEEDHAQRVALGRLAPEVEPGLRRVLDDADGDFDVAENVDGLEPGHARGGGEKDAQAEKGEHGEEDEIAEGSDALSLFLWLLRSRLLIMMRLFGRGRAEVGGGFVVRQQTDLFRLTSPMIMRP